MTDSDLDRPGVAPTSPRRCPRAQVWETLGCPVAPCLSASSLFKTRTRHRRSLRVDRLGQDQSEIGGATGRPRDASTFRPGRPRGNAGANWGAQPKHACGPLPARPGDGPGRSSEAGTGSPLWGRVGLEVTAKEAP